MSDLFERALEAIRLRRTRRRAAAYKELLGGIPRPGLPRQLSPAQEIVLADLAAFCFADQPCFDPDPQIHALKEGRREVWLRIQHFLQLTDRDLQGIKESDYERDTDE